MSVTNELLHGKIPMQMYALGAKSGTTVLYHSWAGLAATINKYHGAQQDSSARIANYLNRPLGLCPRGIFLQLDRKLVCTNPMLHAEPYINYYVYKCNV